MVLVTGGTGLVGAHLIHFLHAQGQPVRALYRSQIPEDLRSKAEWIQGDILDVVGLEQAMQGVDGVYHVAGLVSFSPAQREQLHKVNVEGTANVVNAALSAGIRKLVHVSSVAALGRLRKDAVVDETMEWTEETSNSEYGKTKYLGELEVWRGISEGLNAVIVNPTIVLGEHGDWTKGSMNIFRNIHNGFPWYSLGATGFVDADDVAKAMVMLMQSDIRAERFILSAENMSYRDLFYLVADGFKVKRPDRQVTPLLAGLIWRIEFLRSKFTRREPLITRETAQTSLATVSFNNSKLLKALPAFSYEPMRQSVHRICRVLSERYG